jgi:hypothetical protein
VRRYLSEVAILSYSWGNSIVLLLRMTMYMYASQLIFTRREGRLEPHWFKEKVRTIRKLRVSDVEVPLVISYRYRTVALMLLLA